MGQCQHWAVRLNPKALFQPKQFYGSVIPCQGGTGHSKPFLFHIFKIAHPGAVSVQENVEFLIQELRRPKYSTYFICKYVLLRP